MERQTQLTAAKQAKVIRNAQILELRSQGLPATAIAEQLKLSRITVSAVLKAHPEVEESCSAVKLGLAEKQAQHDARWATENKDRNAQIVALRNQGLPYHQIAAQVGLSTEGARQVLTRIPGGNDGYEAYKSAKAQAVMDKAAAKKQAKVIRKQQMVDLFLSGVSQVEIGKRIGLAQGYLSRVRN